MANVIGVRFQNAGKLYFFDPGAFWPTPGNFVIVETARGVEFGEVVTGVREIDDEQLTSELKKVIRVATAEDVQHSKDNKVAEKEAYGICQKKIVEHKLDMKLVSVEYTFDNSKILFYFTANGRVDFRSLVKDLASIFKTRIELRQIGVRDEAKMLGGLGPCGRPICCGTFLGDFQPVSIKMAKEQNLSLNPNKISGVCGRLMCCLKYEQDTYEQTRKRMPKVGKEVVTPDGNGVVWELNIIKETVRVRIQKGDSSELKDYPMDEVQRVGQQPVRSERAVDEQPVQVPEAVEEASAENVEQLAEILDEQPEKPQRSRRHEQPRQPREKQHPREKREDGEKKDKADKIDKADKSEKTDKREKNTRPSRRENGKGRHGGEQSAREASANSKPVAPKAEQSAPAQVASKSVEKKENAPAVSPWKAAVERALREAHGSDNQK